MKVIKSLSDPITNLNQVSGQYAEKLDKLGIKTVKDMLTYFPRDYKDSSEVVSIATLLQDPLSEEEHTIRCKVTNFKNVHLRSRRTIQSAVAEDNTDSIECVWFNQDYLSRVFSNPDSEFLLVGKLRLKGRKLQFWPTIYEQIFENRENVHLGRIAPEYSLTEGVSKKWFRNRIKSLLDTIKTSNIEIEDELAIISKSTDPIASDIYMVHFPESEKLLLRSVEHLSTKELVDVHLRVIEQNKKKVKQKPVALNILEHTGQLNKFVASLPFKLTEEQQRVIKDIESKLTLDEPLNELIQGDVGSGKTVIVIYLALLMSLNNLQTIILAPTTVLTRQHYETFLKFLPELRDDIELVLSETRDTSSKQILIGTTAVLSRKSKLITNPGLIVVDEQHRFGVHQREELLKPLAKSLSKAAPHFINMTATPIPRTLAETFFGNVNVSTIKTKPKERLPIKTFLVDDAKRADCYTWVKDKVTSEDEQVFWVCSLIDESEEEGTKSVLSTYKKLKKELKDITISYLHGRLKPEEKRQVMKQFSGDKASVLVTTTVIEVGIDVPNANVIIIENAEKFGLAQLHQIRGRVGRGTKQAWCFLFTGDNISPEAEERLEFFAKTNDGLEIAEYDLQRRGPGEVYGTKQAGIPNLKIAKLNNLEMIRKTKEMALKLYEKGVKRIELFR